jgi:exodeoxyribonuclease VIII
MYQAVRLLAISSGTKRKTTEKTMTPTPTPGPIPDLPFQAYQDLEAVSQSTLKAFGEAATPKHFKAAGPKEATADMQFGTICHCAVLEPHRLATLLAVTPAEYPGEVRGKTTTKPWHNGADFCRAWVAEQKALGKIILSPNESSKIPKVRESILSVDLVRSALEHGQTEVSWTKLDDVTGLWLRCRTDLVVTDAAGLTYILDLKKVQVGGATHSEFSKSCATYGYDIQTAAYLEITGASRFLFVAFDPDEPFGVCVYEPDSEMIAVGHRKYRDLLRRYAVCVKTGDWPGYAGGIQKLSLPAWATKEL